MHKFGLQLGGRDQFRYSNVHIDDSGNDAQPKAGTHHYPWLLPVFTGLAALAGLAIGFLLSRTINPLTCQGNDIVSARLAEDQYAVVSKVTTPYHYLEDGLDEADLKVGDPHWASLFPEGDGLVFLSAEFVSSRRLPISASQSHHGNRSVYEMAGYHSLHCLTALRYYIAALVDAQETSQPYRMDEKNRWRHLRHCLADLRQAILCHFDETLLSAQDLEHHPGQEQIKLCTRLPPINAWLEKHYHNTQEA